MTVTLNKTTHEDIEGLFEDAISFACNEYDLPSDVLYKVMEVFAIKKQFQLEQLHNTLNQDVDL